MKIYMTYEKVLVTLIAFSVIILLMAVVADFILYSNRKEIKQEQKSIVATGTMFLFYIVYFSVIRFKLGHISVDNASPQKVLMTVGALMVFSGSMVNVFARIQLQKNWSNHIRIYEDHDLVYQGLYKIVRHPLYSSLMLMFLGGALFYTNPMCAILTVVVFIPFMYYRARQEERMLLKEFDDYSAYRKDTGMFFPKLWR